MKTICLLIVIILFTRHSLYAVLVSPGSTTTGSTASTTSVPVDSVIKQKLDTVIKDVKIIKVSNKAIKDTVDNLAKKVSAKPSCVCQYSDPKDWVFATWVLIFLPVFIFLIVIWILLSKGLSKFDIAEALKENELTKVTVPNPKYDGQQAKAGESDVPLTMEVTANLIYIPAVAANPAANPPIQASDARYEIKDADGNYRPSISRYIAFISSMLIIIIAVCISSFFIYHYIKTGCPPELGALSAVLIALGIGIVPYAVNKVSTAVGGNKSGV